MTSSLVIVPLVESFLNKLAVNQIIKKFYAICWTRRFMNVFTGARFCISRSCLITSLHPSVCLSCCACDTANSGYMVKLMINNGQTSFSWYNIYFETICKLLSKYILLIYFLVLETCESVVVEALCYKLEGCGFESQWGHWVFQFT
jgi:hypothetical protein